ncbi:MAG TPA: RES family NAD+ phosphorylase [Gemmata sp.]
MDGPTLEQFQTLLASLEPAALPFEDVVYRSSTPKYATETDLLTGAGGIKFAGRWNPIGLALVYASLTPETAMAETLAHYRYYRAGIHNAMPRTFVAIEAKLSAVLDLRSVPVLSHLGVSADQLTALDWRTEVQAGREPVTHRLARAVHPSTSPWDGLIVPSAAAPGQYNLLVFPDKCSPGGLRVVNAGHLGNR